jgi:hypothetical protein
MRLASYLVLPTIVGLALAVPVSGTTPGEAAARAGAIQEPDESSAGFAWDPIEVPAESPESGPTPAASEDSLDGEAPEVEAEASASEPSEEASTEAPVPERHAVTLGPVGYDANGRPGRVHVVVLGDTLWDVSEAYLGTPWVWPSVWQDNAAIENPHLIYPGDHIWITPSEMRIVTPEEAEQLLAGQPSSEHPPASLGDAPPSPDASSLPAPVYPFSAMEVLGVVTEQELDAASSVVDSPHDRIWLGQHDSVFVGLGPGEVTEGDQFTVFRVEGKVLHPETRALVGHHVDVLGWLEVTEVEGETALARVEQSYGEMRRGDRILPRKPVPGGVEVRPALDAVKGQVLLLPDSRMQTGSEDVLFLDRGSDDGLRVGNPIEIYRLGRTARDIARGNQVRTPDWVVANAIVVSIQDGSAVGLITHATTELARGDLFRTSSE